MPDDGTATKEDSLAAALVTVGEMMQPIIEAASGYRAQVIAAGFAPAAADLMAGEYHSALIALVRKANPEIWGPST